MVAMETIIMAILYNRFNRNSWFNDYNDLWFGDDRENRFERDNDWRWYDNDRRFDYDSDNHWFNLNRVESYRRTYPYRDRDDFRERQRERYWEQRQKELDQERERLERQWERQEREHERRQEQLELDRERRDRAWQQREERLENQIDRRKIGWTMTENVTILIPMITIAISVSATSIIEWTRTIILPEAPADKQAGTPAESGLKDQRVCRTGNGNTREEEHTI